MANSKQINISIIEIFKKILDPIKIIGAELISNKDAEDNKIEVQAKQIERQESGYIGNLEHELSNTNKKPEKGLQRTVRKVENAKGVFAKTEIKHKEQEKAEQKDYEIDD